MRKLHAFPKTDIALNTKMYDEYIQTYRMHNGWQEGNQEYNFKALSRINEMTGVPFRGASLLDVGCGTGDLVDFLKDEELAHYVGIDIYRPSLNIAREKHPQVTFIEGDLLTEAFPEQFDYAICSGSLTIKLSIDNYTFLEAMIAKMWELTRVGIAFNVLTDDDPDPDTDIFFYNPERVLQICHDIAPDAVLGAEETPNVAQIHVYMYRDQP